MNIRKKDDKPRDIEGAEFTEYWKLREAQAAKKPYDAERLAVLQAKRDTFNAYWRQMRGVGNTGSPSYEGD